MPNSLEAEQSVVGSMIMSKDAIVTASEMLLKEDFYHQQYGIIFETMVELFTEGQPVDLVTLQNRLKEKDVPQEIQSLDFVRTLVTSVPTSCILSFIVMYLLKKSDKFSSVSISLVGGVCHNIGQIIVAAIVLSTYSVVYYIPVLLVAGCITGLVIGIVASQVLLRISDSFHV